MSLKYIILGVLNEGPHHGYELKRKFETAPGNIWPISFGQLYPTLKRLTKNGYLSFTIVIGGKAAGKKVYAITEKGKEEFQSWMKNPRKKISFSLRDEFSLYYYFVNKYDKENIRSAIKQHYTNVENQYINNLKILNTLPPSVPFCERALLRKRLLHIDAEKKWLEEVFRDS